MVATFCVTLFALGLIMWLHRKPDFETACLALFWSANAFSTCVKYTVSDGSVVGISLFILSAASLLISILTLVILFIKKVSEV